MDMQDKIAMTTVRCAAVCFCVFVGGIAACDGYTSKLKADAVTEMVRLGANPIDAACGTWTAADGDLCIARAGRN